MKGLKSSECGQVICTVKYPHHLVLLAKAVTVLQGMIHTLNETERCYGIEMNGGGGVGIR